MIAACERQQAIQNGHGLRRSVARAVIIRLDPATSADRVTMCAVIDRIPAFLARLHSDNPPGIIQRFIHAQWIAGNQTVAVWVARNERGHVVGHLIATIEHAWGVPFAMLIQVELDTPYLTTAVQRRALCAELDAWAASQGATTIKTLTPRNPDVFPRYNGFTADKMLMVRKVEVV
jgi:hypothetical protein